MALTSAFIEAVADSNIQRVRIMMKDSLWADPSFAEYNEMEKTAASLPGLFVLHDGKEFQNDKSLWNHDYLSHIMTDLMFNFSHERISHIKEVIRCLAPADEARDAEPEKKAQKNSLKIALTGAVSGMVLGGAAAVLTADYAMVIATVSGGALIGGVVGKAVFSSKEGDKNGQ